MENSSQKNDNQTSDEPQTNTKSISISENQVGFENESDARSEPHIETNPQKFFSEDEIDMNEDDSIEFKYS